jgi:hypothetical protein
VFQDTGKIAAKIVLPSVGEQLIHAVVADPRFDLVLNHDLRGSVKDVVISLHRKSLATDWESDIAFHESGSGVIV